MNTVIVGLAAVNAGVAQKPADLAVSWTGTNPAFLAKEARQFATKSLLVYAVDALDKYLDDIGREPSPITDKSLRDILIGEPQITSPPATFLPAMEIAKLKAVLDNGTASEIISQVAAFDRAFGEKRKPPHVRLKLDTLASKFPAAPAYYLAAVHLLVSWRNRHVHQSNEKINNTIQAELLNNKEVFWNDHSHTDIALTLQHYNEKGGPSLKDVSTLISVLQRAISILDHAIVFACDLDEFTRQALKKALTVNGGEERLIKIWCLAEETRRRKLTVYLQTFGFQSERPEKSGRQLYESFFSDLFQLDRTAAANYFGI